MNVASWPPPRLQYFCKFSFLLQPEPDWNLIVETFIIVSILTYTLNQRNHQCCVALVICGKDFENRLFAAEKTIDEIKFSLIFSLVKMARILYMVQI